MRRNSPEQIGCSVLLIIYSAFFVCLHIPYYGWRFGAALGVLAIASLLLRVGWLGLCTIAGVYFGMEVLDPAVKSGTIEYQMRETIFNTSIGAILGFVVGVVADVYNIKAASRPPK